MYSLKYPYSADYEFMLRIKKQEEVRFTEIYEIISNFSVDGASGSVRAYRDTLRLLHDRQLIENSRYWGEMLKSWVILKFRK